jgi:hypothetical protein
MYDQLQHMSGIVKFGQLTLSYGSFTATFRELGPPDLCHVVKVSGPKNALKEVC